MILEDILDNVKNFSKLMKDINPQTEDSLQTLNRMKKKIGKKHHIYTYRNARKNILKIF